MTARRTLRLGPVSVSPAWVTAGALGFAFLIAVGLRHETRSIADLALVAIALAGGAWLARLASGAGSLRVVGLITALIAAWLLAQRNDGPSAVILAAFFGAGVGLMAGPRPLDPDPAPRPARSRTAGAVLLLAVIVFAAYVGAETPSVHWFGGGITHGPTGRRDVALTFDDGPNLTATLPIMRILDAAGVKGTFFEVGHAIDKEPWITSELYRDGQGLGNHSYHHDQWRWLDPRYPELSRTQATFQKAIGVCPTFYRPPHGDRTPFVARVVNDHHMRMILWDDSSGDWAVKNPRTIARRILRGAKPGAIIVLHDGLNGNPLANRTVLVKALPLILAGLREKDLHPVRLDQLIGGPAFMKCG
jgi:peptidoglycan-N-acetylglucosamine deacetylase